MVISATSLLITLVLSRCMYITLVIDNPRSKMMYIVVMQTTANYLQRNINPAVVISASSFSMFTVILSRCVGG